MSTLSLVILIVGIALLFDFINGFHDSANSIATIVAPRVFSPLRALAWAASFTFVAAFTFGTAVADTVGKGFVDLGIVTPYVVLAGVIGAIVWDLITWWLGLPTSSSHALIGGYAGAAMARAAFLYPRNLVDLFEVAIDPLNGRAAIAYVDDTLTSSGGSPLP